MEWVRGIDTIRLCLGRLTVSDAAGSFHSADDGFARWTSLTEKIRGGNNTIYLIGNGASASMASHIAADLAKNAHINTEVFFDLSLMTAISNDISFDEVFAEPIRRRFKQGDMVVAISSSGQSENVLRAVEEVKRLDGTAITLSAMDEKNQLRKKGTLNFYIPAETYGMAETCHAAILHFWMDKVAL